MLLGINLLTSLLRRVVLSFIKTIFGQFSTNARDFQVVINTAHTGNKSIHLSRGRTQTSLKYCFRDCERDVAIAGKMEVWLVLRLCQ